MWAQQREHRLMLDLHGPLGVLQMRLQPLQTGLTPTSVSHLWTTAPFCHHFNTGEIERAVFWSFPHRPFYCCFDLLKKSRCNNWNWGHWSTGSHRGKAPFKQSAGCNWLSSHPASSDAANGYQRFLLMLRNQVNMGIPENELLC